MQGTSFWPFLDVRLLVTVIQWMDGDVIQFSRSPFSYEECELNKDIGFWVLSTTDHTAK